MEEYVRQREERDRAESVVEEARKTEELSQRRLANRELGKFRERVRFKHMPLPLPLKGNLDMIIIILLSV